MHPGWGLPFKNLQLGNLRIIERRNKALQVKYRSKLRTADEAVRMIRSGQRVFIGSSGGEPQCLVNALMDKPTSFQMSSGLFEFRQTREKMPGA